MRAAPCRPSKMRTFDLLAGVEVDLGVALDLVALADERDDDVGAAVGQVARDHEAVAAVVARAAEDDDARARQRRSGAR